MDKYADSWNWPFTQHHERWQMLTTLQPSLRNCVLPTESRAYRGSTLTRWLSSGVSLKIVIGSERNHQIIFVCYVNIKFCPSTTPRKLLSICSAGKIMLLGGIHQEAVNLYPIFRTAPDLLFHYQSVKGEGPDNRA